MTAAAIDPSTRDALGNWAVPLVGDIVWTAYKRASLDEATAGTLARLHIILLRHLLFDDPASVPARRDLLTVAKNHGIEEGDVCQIDNDVLAELMHVISRRFRRSPDRTRDCGLEVMRVACWLTAAAKAA